MAVVKPGRILYEIEGVDETTAREAMRLAQAKLPIKTKFVTTRGSGRRRDLDEASRRVGQVS